MKESGSKFDINEEIAKATKRLDKKRNADLKDVELAYGSRVEAQQSPSSIYH